MSDLAGKPTGAGTRVVVVDDHQIVAETVMRLVNSIEGFSAAAWASTAAEGIAAVVAHHPDVVVLDSMLPDEDGANLARRIRTVAPRTKLIMLTGASAPRALIEAMDAGCVGFVEKTKAATELVRVLQAVVTGVSDFPSELLQHLPRLDDLVVHYQPIVDLDSEAAVGAEALVRWNHPDRGLVGPAEFIAEAEEVGLIVALGGRVLADACQQASAWRSELPDAKGLSVSVNASAQQLARPDFVAHLEDALLSARLPADGLVVELTETGVMDADPGTLDRLRGVRALGVELRVDDFGTGYSSLANLRRFPIGALKVDRSFVHGMLSHAEDAEIVAASIRLAHSLGLRSVAEGVEHEGEAARLRELGCELAQGYLWSPALAPDAFASWYIDHTRSLSDLFAPGRVREGEAGGDTVDDSGTVWRAGIQYVHCGWCHRKGAYVVPGRAILRCKYCQASTSIPRPRGTPRERELKTRARHLKGLRTTKREPDGLCNECPPPVSP